MNKEELENKVKNALENLRPYLQADGGDIELVRITDNGIVEVRFLGFCKSCALSQMTLRAGVERALLREAPGIKRVELVN
jgi:Fe-S cluster biogenesis protein NfuA